MATTNLGIAEILESQSNKHVTANAAFESLDLAGNAVNTVTIDATADTAGVLLTQANLAAGVIQRLVASGADGAFNLQLPAVSRLFMVDNQSGFTATVMVDPAQDGADGTTVTVADSKVVLLYSDGTDVILIADITLVGASNFTELGDVPSAYTGHGLKLVRVNSGATALEFVEDNVLPIVSDANTNRNSTLTDRYVEMTNGSANTYTVMANATVAHPIGATITIEQNGAGTTTITPDTGVTILSRGSLVATAGQYAVVTLVKKATNTWVLTGDLA